MVTAIRLQSLLIIAWLAVDLVGCSSIRTVSTGCDAQCQTRIAERAAAQARAQEKREADLRAASERAAVQQAAEQRIGEERLAAEREAQERFALERGTIERAAAQRAVAQQQALVDTLEERLAATSRLLGTRTTSHNQAMQQLNLAQLRLKDLERRIAQSQVAPQSDSDDELKNVKLGTAAIKAVDKMRQGEPYHVELAISMSPNDIALLKQLGAKGSEGRVWKTPYTKTMVAWLEGRDFEIEPKEHREQYVPGTPAPWEWTVTPLEWGTKDLFVHMALVIKVDGVEKTKELLLPPHRVRVSISPLYKPKLFVSGNWQWLSTTILIPIAAFLWGARRQKKRIQAGFAS